MTKPNLPGLAAPLNNRFAKRDKKTQQRYRPKPIPAGSFHHVCGAAHRETPGI